MFFFFFQNHPFQDQNKYIYTSKTNLHKMGKAPDIYFNNYSWFHIEGTWSVNSFNRDYLSIPEGTSSCEYLFMKSPVFAAIEIHSIHSCEVN